MKNILRAALVVFSLAGIYAGISAPTPAANQPKPAITLSEGSEPTPTTLPPAPKPPSPKTT
ncbi:MAG: hypothetical protein M3P27_05020 [Acidobacteriota bacterium]|nr:hypothetical protein [Acidobacteriota bacterium]